MELKHMECPYCGANLKIAPEATHCRCIYCNSDFQIDKNVEMEHKTSVDSDGYITLQDGTRVKPFQTYSTVQTDHRGESKDYDFYYDHTGKVHWGATPAEKLKRVKLTILSVVIAVVGLPILGLIMFMSDRDTKAVTEASIDPYLIDESFDPYSVVEVSVDGTSGQGTLHINFTQSAYASLGYWTASKDRHLANGDIVTVQFTPRSLHTPQEIQGRYYIFTEDDAFDGFTFEVSGLNEFAKDLEEQGASAEDLDRFCQMAEEEIDKTALKTLSSSEADLTVADVDYLGYITRIKHDYVGGELLLLYKVTLNWYGQPYEKYVPVGFRNVKVTPDGSLVCDGAPYLDVLGVPSDMIGKTDTFAKPPVWSVGVYGFDSFSTLETTLLFGYTDDYKMTYGHYEE